MDCATTNDDVTPGTTMHMLHSITKALSKKVDSYQLSLLQHNLERRKTVEVHKRCSNTKVK